MVQSVSIYDFVPVGIGTTVGGLFGYLLGYVLDALFSLAGAPPINAKEVLTIVAALIGFLGSANQAFNE